jgi:hypothetical protein
VITQEDAQRIAHGKLSDLERPVTITRVIELEDQWEVHWDSPGYDPNEVEGVPIGNPLLLTKQDGSIIHVHVAQTMTKPRSK